MTIPAIYIHSTACVPYAEAIAEGYKTIETRNRDTLGRFVGQRVLVIRTRNHKPAEIIGSVSITGKSFCRKEDFQDLFDQHLVQPGSRYDAAKRGKWCYSLADAHKQEPVRLSDMTVTSKTRSYAIVEI